MSKKIILFPLFFILTVVSSKILSIDKTSSLFDNNNKKSYINNILNVSKYSQNKTKLEKITKLRNLLLNADSNESNDQDSPGSVPSILFDLFDIFASFLHINGLVDLLDKEEIETCFFDGIIENVLNIDLLNIYIDGSGKAANDFGNEFVCNYNIRRNVSYFTLHFFLGTEDFKKDKEEFFEQEYFYIGLCLPRKCIDAVKFLIINEKVVNITHQVGLSNFKLYVNEDVVDQAGNLDEFYSIVIGIYIALNILKLLIGILRVIFINKGYEGYYAELERKLGKQSNTFSLGIGDPNEINLKNSCNSSDSSTSSEIVRKTSYNSSSSKNLENSNANASLIYDSEISENIISEGDNLYNPFSDKEKEFHTPIKVMKIFDLFDNLKILSTHSNKYYNSNRINSLYFIRFLLMIMSIIYQIMNTQVDLPTKNYYNFEFYSNFVFTLIKLCVNASTFWITLDGVIFAYKLMSYMKKEIKLSRNSSIRYLTFLKFLLLILPKFFIFLFAFILLHLKASKLTFALCKGNNVFANYLYYNDTVQQKYYSLRTTHEFKDFFHNFIPFKLNYIDFIENIPIERIYNTSSKKNFTSEVSGYEIPSPFLTNTDLFVNVCFNEFYLIILMVNITFISYKLKNDIFDFSILIINIILFILPAIGNLNPMNIDINEQKYTLKYVLGQNYSEKYTHYFINFFYFGFLIGVMKFYHDDNLYNMKKKKNFFENIILPYQFCKKIITYLNSLHFYLKRAILLICIFILLIISMSFTLLEGKNFTSREEKDIELVKITGIVKFLFFYEKNLCGIFFFIFLIMYIVYPKNSYIIKISSATMFLILERISFAFYISFCYLIYAQFCVFIISMQMSYSNLFFNTVGMFFIVFVFSLLSTALFELPIRMLVKYIMNRNLENNFIYYYNKYHSNTSSSFSSDENDSSNNTIKED